MGTGKVWLLGLGLVFAAEQVASGLTELSNDVAISSPSSEYQARVAVADGNAVLSIQRRGVTILQPSLLGVVFADVSGKEVAVPRFESIQANSPSNHDSTWKPVWGERSTVRDRYSTTICEFKSSNAEETLRVEIRAYDQGIAYRYLLGDAESDQPFRIARELTEFCFAADHQAWAVTSAQGVYSKVRLSELQHSIERPCVLESDAGSVIAIAEAALVDYARMRLRRAGRAEGKEHTLVSVLHGQGKTIPVELAAGKTHATPWRVVMAGDSAGELLENNDLLLNLNEPCKIADTSWIKPGKVLREVSLSTDGGKACVDFAVKYGLQFIEYDAGWYGPQNKEESDARTVSRNGLDLQEVIRYAKEKDIGVILYVNRRHLESQLDELLPVYKKWGIAGIKYGFVQHGSQKWTAWMHDAIRKTAEHQIMVDVHDEYRMTGWQRTYPSFMTAEGIGGDETRPTNEQALANLFTRMIVSPADHTFQHYSGYVSEKTSHASQLAKSVCFFSPWQFLFWYDRPATAEDEPELQFFKHLPTTWDDSRVLEGKIGEYAVITRRHGNDWFVGCLNAVKDRTLDVPLSFLPKGREFNAEIYRDDPSVDTRTYVGVERRSVTSETVLKAVMSARGGMAVRIVAGE